MAHEFIKDKFEGRMGTFLNARFKQPIWVKGYEIGRLNLND